MIYGKQVLQNKFVKSSVVVKLQTKSNPTIYNLAKLTAYVPVQNMSYELPEGIPLKTRSSRWLRIPRAPRRPKGIAASR